MSVNDRSREIIEFSGGEVSPFWSIDWGVVEERLGHKLPADYKRVCDAVPPGKFTGFFWILHPLGSFGAHLLREESELRDTLRELVEVWDQDEVPDFVDPDILYPCLSTDNGDVAYWRAEVEEPEEWTVVINWSRSPDWWESGLSLTDLLYEHITHDPDDGPFSAALENETPEFSSEF
jgi:hypothetical protein